MRVETFATSPNAVPGLPDVPRLNPAAESAGWTAAAEASRGLMSVAHGYQQRYDNARREADAATLQAETMQRLGDARFRWSKVPDSVAAEAGFADEATKIRADIAGRINDPLIAAKFGPHFDERASAESIATKGAAFSLESSKRKGELITSLDTYAHAMAQATNPLDRQQIMDTASHAIAAYENGGWIKPEDAANLRLNTRSKADEVLARQVINDDPEHAVRVLGDAANFPYLNEKTREVLERQAATRADTMVKQRVAQAEKDERTSERQLKITQGLNEIALIGRLDSATPPTLQEAETLASRRQISVDGYQTVRRAILNGELGRDEPEFVNNLHARILSGEASLAEIREAPLSSISMKTKSTMLDKWKGVQEGGAYASRDYRTAMEDLRAAIVTTGPGAQFVRSDEQQKLARARQELDGWIRTNKVGVDDTQRIWEKVGEMMPRYQSAPPSTYGLPRPRLGEVKSRDDVQAIGAATYSNAKTQTHEGKSKAVCGGNE